MSCDHGTIHVMVPQPVRDNPSLKETTNNCFEALFSLKSTRVFPHAVT